MSRRPGRLLAVTLPLLLLACQKTAPGGVTPSEDSALNDAAAMLDANSVDDNALSPDDGNQGQPR